jgi:hypothetical protein
MPTIISFDNKKVNLDDSLPTLPRETKNLFVMKHLRSAHLPLGKVVEVTKEYMIRIFPNNFFKHVYVGTALNSVAETKGKSDLSTFRKLSPSLALIPTYVPQDSLFENQPVYTMLNWTNGMPPPVKDWEKYLKKLFYHETSGNEIFYNISRVKLSFDMAIRLGTEIKAWDIVTILRRRLHSNYYFYINNQRLPIELPNLITLVLAKELNLDLTDTVQSNTLVDILNKYSKQNTFYKYRNPATGNEGIAFDYITNLLFKVDGDFSYEKGLIGKSQEKTIITNNISCEFNLPDTFALSTFDVISESFTNSLSLEISNYKYLNVQLSTRPPQHLGDLTLVDTTKFITDTGDDVLDFIDAIPRVYTDFIKNEAKKPSTSEVRILLWNSEGLVDSTKYTVDYKNMQIVANELLPKQIYYFGIYVNLLKVKEFAQPVIDATQLVKLKEKQNISQL